MKNISVKSTAPISEYPSYLELLYTEEENGFFISNYEVPDEKIELLNLWILLNDYTLEFYDG